jgi:hypothetical protein
MRLTPQRAPGTGTSLRHTTRPACDGRCATNDGDDGDDDNDATASDEDDDDGKGDVEGDVEDAASAVAADATVVDKSAIPASTKCDSGAAALCGSATSELVSTRLAPAALGGVTGGVSVSARENVSHSAPALAHPESTDVFSSASHTAVAGAVAGLTAATAAPSTVPSNSSPPTPSLSSATERCECR